MILFLMLVLSFVTKWMLDMRKMVCFEKQENHFVGVHEKFRKKLLICGLCFRNILCVQLNDFMS